MTERSPHPLNPPPIGGMDRFETTGERMVSFLQDHLLAVLLVVVLILGLGGTMFGISAIRDGNRAADQAKLAQIAEIYPSNEADIPETRIRMAIEQYQAFLADAPGGLAEAVAAMNLARAHEALGDTEAAATSYRELAAGDPPIADVATLRLGYLLLTQDQTAEAEAAFEQVVARGSGLAPQAALDLARIAEARDDRDTAIARYRTLTETYTNYPQANEAAVRLRILGAVPLPNAQPVPPTTPADTPTETPAPTTDG